MDARSAGAVKGGPDLAGLLCLAAASLAAAAAAISSLVGDHDLVPFFVLLTLAAGVAAWAVERPASPARRALARLLGIAWLAAAVWIGGLLVWYQAACACSSPAPVAPDPTFLGLPATAFHLAATYVGGAFVAVATLGRAGRTGRADRAGGPATDRAADEG